MTFSPLVGAQFRHYTDDLYELVIVRDDALCASQKVFFIYPHLTQWPTKDLMSKHPTKEGMWKYRGRTDDIIVLLNDVNINPLLMERILMSHPKVVAALLTGTGNVKGAWPIGVVHPPQNEEETTSLVEELWPTVEKANDATYRTEGKGSKDKIIFTSKDKSMLRAGKGSVQRKFTLVSFRQ
ncbi:hypothetical protein BTUL_0215g00080 [Botrytis tulipae]|uniref:AMP-binding enzyme C-terminal domain-containing protein n=1 Tax=Botrytis tulipae TaxID=87230 RepID=A0A4Z1E884_9HELO|nr:hypothetical protein BTUL_0215g00080 [Botrytis tulipae]